MRTLLLFVVSLGVAVPSFAEATHTRTGRPAVVVKKPKKPVKAVQASDQEARASRRKQS